MSNVLPSGRRGLRLSARAVSVSTVAVVVVAGGGLAYAAWSVTAAGSSQARSTTPVQSTVTASLAAADLYPGASAPVYFTVTNNNSFPVSFTAASFGTVTSDDPTACPASNVTVTNQAISVSLQPGVTSAVQTPAGAVTMSGTAPTGCQGRTFTVATTLAGTSS